MTAEKRTKTFLLRVLSFIWTAIKTILIGYAVAFSVLGTVVIVVAYNMVMAPIKEVKLLRLSNPSETAYMAAYRQSINTDSLADSLTQRFIPLDSISDYLKTAVLAAEDDGFYTHPGFDIEAILAAVEYNRARGSVKRGASTITQQLAKNLFLSNERSFERKFKELAYTLLMEKYLGKDRIFELYLNYAQWGKTTFGCEAAAQQFFQKSASKLTRWEAARMAATLAMPSRITPHHLKSGFMGKRLAVIANNLYLHGSIDDSGYETLTGYPPPRPDADTVTTDTLLQDSTHGAIGQ